MDADVNGNVAVSFKRPSNPVWFFFAPHEYYSITRLLTSLEPEVDKKTIIEILTSELCWWNSYRQQSINI
jgi:hypothetical protein